MLMILLGVVPLALLIALVIAFRVAASSRPGPTIPDPVGLRTVVVFDLKTADPTDLIDGMARSLEAEGAQPSPWQWTRDGLELPCSMAETEVLLHVTIYAEVTLRVLGRDASGLMVGPPADSTATRAILRALHKALRANGDVSRIGWRRREDHGLEAPATHHEPFEGA